MIPFELVCGYSILPQNPRYGFFFTNAASFYNLRKIKAKSSDNVGTYTIFTFINNNMVDSNSTHSTVFYKDGKLYGIELKDTLLKITRLI